MSQLDKYFSDKLQDLRSASRLRVIRNYSKELVDFSSNDYLGLINDGRLKKAACEAIEKYGVGAGASRLLTGNSELYDRLEAELAKYYNKQAACVFSSGYATNIGAIPALVEKGDLVIADKLSHSCIIEGVQLSGAKFLRYRHNDYAHLKKLLKDNRKDYKNCLVISEATFSMDGDKADIAKLNSIAHEYNSFTYVDYAHEITSDKNKPDIVMGTFSKAFASLGGYICASQEVVDYIKTKAKSLIYSTALPPSVLAASLEALTVHRSNPDIASRCLDNAAYFCELMGLEKPSSQIVPILIGDDKKLLGIREKIEQKGFVVSAIRPPTVPEGTARLRFSFSASHTREQIVLLAKVIKEVVVG